MLRCSHRRVCTDLGRVRRRFVHGRPWTSLCGCKFAKALGDEALDNVSLLAALQPTDVKEAIETVQGSPIARTKLRMVFAVARVMFGLSPVDVERHQSQLLHQRSRQGRYRVLRVGSVCA